MAPADNENNKLMLSLLQLKNVNDNHATYSLGSLGAESGLTEERHLHRSLTPGVAVVVLPGRPGNGLLLVQDGQHAEDYGDRRLQLDLLQELS